MLDALPQVSRNDRVHAQEHALEVQLPFLQLVLDDFTLVPLAVGDAAPEAVAQVLERLWGGDETLIVISSDLSHYLPYGQARVMDAHGGPGAGRAQQPGPADACGAMPLNGAMLCARRHWRPACWTCAIPATRRGPRARGGLRGRPSARPRRPHAAGEAGRLTRGRRPGPALLARRATPLPRRWACRCARAPPGAGAPGATFVTLHPGAAARRLHRPAGRPPLAGRGRAAQRLPGRL
jgi:hypothetical protein